MSLLIKGVEMPDSCLNCRFRTTMLKNVLSPTMRTSVYACLISGMEINNWYEAKHKDCPLIGIPTPHGRLIDADELYDPMERDLYAGIGCDPTCIAAITISKAPTIIEAEASE